MESKGQGRRRFIRTAAMGAIGAGLAGGGARASSQAEAAFSRTSSLCSSVPALRGEGFPSKTKATLTPASIRLAVL